jgi:hypothetical protein
VLFLDIKTEHGHSFDRKLIPIPYRGYIYTYLYNHIVIMFALTKLQQYIIFIGTHFQDNIFSMKKAELSITIT